MTVLLVIAAVWCVAFAVSFTLLCRAASRRDAQIVDLDAQRRLRALGEAAARHPSGRGKAL